MRCNQYTHLASKCPIYKDYCDTNCRRCNLLHPTKDCKQNETRVNTGELVLDEVVEPELLEAEQDGDVEFVPEAGVEQDHEMFQETEGYEEQWDNYPETDWEVAENDFYEDNL